MTVDIAAIIGALGGTGAGAWVIWFLRRRCRIHIELDVDPDAAGAPEEQEEKEEEGEEKAGEEVAVQPSAEEKEEDEEKPPPDVMEDLMVEVSLARSPIELARTLIRHVM